MNAPQMEHEVPPRRRDFGVIKGWLLNHPFIHFAVMFCYWFTATSVLNSLWVHGFHRSSWTEGHIYFFSSFMAIAFYFTYRHRMKNSKA
jgi:hypothetical protein